MNSVTTTEHDDRIWAFRDRWDTALKWLDENKPGWADMINLEEFDIAHPYYCIGSYIGTPWQWLMDEIQDDTGKSVVGAFSSGDEWWKARIAERQTSG